MGKGRGPPKKKAAAKKGNTYAAKGSQQEPIMDANDAASRALRHLPVAVPPASSTDAHMETAADYQGSIRNDDEVPPQGQFAIESIIILIPHTLSSIMDPLTVIGSSRKEGGPSERLVSELHTTNQW